MAAAVLVLRSEDERRQFVETFEERGQSLRAFGSVHEALAAAKKLKPMVVIVEPDLLVAERADLSKAFADAVGGPVNLLALTDRPTPEQALAIKRHGARRMIRPPDEVSMAYNVGVLTESRAAGPLAAPPTQEPAKHSGVTILVVEDSATMRMVLAKILNAAGHRVLYAEKAATALRILAAGLRVDLIVSDLVMPGMDGFELKHEIDRGREEPMPFILVTAEVTEDNKAIALALGRSEFVPKPVVPKKLLSAVERLLGARAPQL